MLQIILSALVSLGVFLFVSLASQNEASAITTYTEKITCPLNGKTTTIMKYGSYNFVGRRLDTKSMLLGSPQVLPLPICKENGFAIYKNDFNDVELEKARELVSSAKFRRLSKIHTSHYMGAFEAEFLGESQFKIAHLYLIASWETEENKTRRTRVYMSQSLRHFLLYLKFHDEHDSRWLVAQILSANLERKLGKFDDAIGRINSLSIDSFNRKSRAYLTAKKILHYAEQRNIAPQRL
jgi:hypothetical protein